MIGDKIFKNGSREPDHAPFWCTWTWPRPFLVWFITVG